MKLLTDEEITLIAREAAKGSAINRDGGTSLRIGRAIEAAILAKIGEPVAEVEWAAGIKNSIKEVVFKGGNWNLPIGTKLYAIKEQK